MNEDRLNMPGSTPGSSSGSPAGSSRPNGGSRSDHADPGQSARSSGHNRLKEQTGRVVEDLRELGHVARDEAGNAIDTAKERGQRALEHGRERYDDYRVGMEQRIGEKPITAVLIAAGAGALLGYMMRGR